MLPKLKWTFQHLESGGFGHRLHQPAIAWIEPFSVQVGQDRLVIKSVHLADTPIHEQLNYPLGLGSVIHD
jgi:hypothetical protein